MTDCMLIKDIRKGMKNINVVFIMLDIGKPKITKGNREVRTCKVADSSACINISIWDEPGQLLMPGDIVQLTKGYAGIWQNCLTLYPGKHGDLQKKDEFCMVFNEELNMSEPIPRVSPIANTNQIATVGAAGNSAVPVNNASANNNGGILNHHSPPNNQLPSNSKQPNAVRTGRGNGGNRFGNGGRPKPHSKGNPRPKQSHRNGPRRERR